MKLVIERAALLKTLSHVQNVVERRASIPILQNVRIEAGHGLIALAATDMDMEVTETVTAAIGNPGVTTVNAGTLTDICRKLPDGSQIQLTQSDDGGQMTISAGRSRFTLPCLPAEDYPVIGGIADDINTARFTLTPAQFDGLFARARFAISTEETRYYLNGIYLHPKAEALRAVATDGHRLAWITGPLGNNGGKNGTWNGVIVPRKCVLEALRLTADLEEDIDVAVSDAKIRFTCGPVTLTSKLIDGTFPDYERVVPTGNDKQVKVDRAALAEAVDRVSAVCSEKTRSIKLAVTKGEITLTASGSDTGSGTEEIECDYTGAAVEVGFNAKYLHEILSQSQGDRVLLSLADSASPALISDPADSSALYVLMPMRV